MNHRQVIAWVLSVCTGCLRKSQAKTLSVLVAGAVRLQRVSLANLGRNLAGPVSAKHKIKRAWRFVVNERVGIHDAMTGVLELLGKRWRREYRKKPLLVTFDWTDLRGLQTLMACAVVKGRSVPLIWASCSRNTWEGHQSRNAFEEALLLLLRDLLPKALGLEIVILADRGFGRTELGRFCQNQGFHYVIRIQPKVMIQVGSVRTRLDRYPVQKGQCFKLSGVLYRRHDPVTQHIIVRWKKGLPKRRDEAWYLMTDLPQGARTLSDLYGKRMEIEEFFRDVKNKRAGWSLRDTLITDPDRLDRLILILAIAYLLLVGLGLYAAQRHRPGRWCSNQRLDSLSAFTIGQCELLLSHVPIPRVLAALLAAAAKASGKWG